MPLISYWKPSCLLVLLAASATALAGDGDRVDSGWNFAQPTPSAASPQAAVQSRMALDYVLRQTEEGLQIAPAPPDDALHRIAERAEKGSVWRPIGSGPVLPSEANPWQSWSLNDGELRRDEVATDKRTLPPNQPTSELEFRVPLGRAEGDVPPPSSTSPVIESVPTDDRPTEALPSENSAGALLPERILLSDRRPAESPPSPPDVSELDENATTDVDGQSAAGDTAATTDEKSPEETTVPPPTVVTLAPPPPLTSQLVSLRTRVRSVLRGYYKKSLNSQENDPWEVMHGVLAFGIHSRIRQNSPRGQHITAVGWLCYNRPCKGKSLLYVTREGELRAKQGVGLQGHMGQLLAMLAQSHVSPDYPILIGNQQFTVRDLIEAEKKTCYEKSELTFKLIALTHYEDLDATWVNDQGLDWDIPKLIREELAQPIRGAACGGTHRLSGLSLAVKARVKSGQPVDGVYAQADEFVKNYQNYAFRMQNRDGSLSTKWFQGPGDESDNDRRVQTTGHILEWLIYSQSDEELRDPRTIRAVTYLTNLMYSNYDREWEVGPISHATHALLLYDERVFQPHDADGQSTLTSARDGSRGAGSRGGRR